jgi:UDP-N-acetylmuramate dehydrogenase
MQIIQNYPLKYLNTFGIQARAAFFTELQSEHDIKTFLHTSACRDIPLLILGGGSNVLLTKDFDGCVAHVNNKGIEVTAESEEYVMVAAAAGELWENLIAFCMEHNYGGLENLSGIPGTVGSCPIQNIGAYGVEVKDCIAEVHAYMLDDCSKRILMAEECGFGYRDSIFKRELKGKVLIEKVVFCLSKQPEFKLSYKGVLEEVMRMSQGEIHIRMVSEAIKQIRGGKIPDTITLGSAGSFFKNPCVDKRKMDELLKEFHEISYYKNNEDNFKLAAAWMIEQCGWKGHRKGDAGVNATQPLILVNYGNASGQEILDLSMEIQKSVEEKFGVHLEAEVNIV